MAEEGVKGCAFSKIPNLHLRVVGYTGHVKSTRMEVDHVHATGVGVVMLEQLVISQIVDFDSFVIGARGKALNKWVKSPLHFVPGKNLTALIVPA